MGPKSKKSSSGNTADDATALRVAEIVNESLALRIIELLSDDVLLSNLKKALFSNQLATKIDALTPKVSHLTSQLDKKVERIAELETKVQSLEDTNDTLEQYSRRPNIRISGIAEAVDGEDTNEKVLAMINGKMNLQPPYISGRSNVAIASAVKPPIASVMRVPPPHDRGLSSWDCVVSASVTSCSDQGLASRNTTGKIRIIKSS